MKVLLLASIPPKNKIIPALIKYQGENLLDWQVSQLQKYGYEVIVVIGNEMGDEILKSCKKIADCELVVDVNDEPNWATGLKSGLAVVHRECFVLPVVVPCPEKSVWDRIHRHLYRIGYYNEFHVGCPFCPVKGEMVPGYPLMITRHGIDHITESENWSEPNAKSLIFSPVPILDKSITQDLNADGSKEKLMAI